jgi:hypothetical protein
LRNGISALSGARDKTWSDRSHLSKLGVGLILISDFRKPGLVCHDLRTDVQSAGSV